METALTSGGPGDGANGFACVLNISNITAPLPQEIIGDAQAAVPKAQRVRELQSRDLDGTSELTKP